MTTSGTGLPPPQGSHTWDKAAWRAWARRTRRALSSERPGISAAVAEHITSSEHYRSAQVVGVYLAFGHELDLAHVIAAARLDGKVVAAPRAADDPEPHLTLHELRPGSALAKHRLGQNEPTPDAPLVPPERVDLLLVPGLAFDERGHRLGYGLGYYDRLLPRLRAGALTVGVAQSALVVPALPTGAHDATVAFLVTETGLRRPANPYILRK